MYLLRFVVIPLGLLFLALRADAQTPPAFDQAHREKIVGAAARLLEEKYVFPDVGRECGEHISERLAAGAFNGLDDPEEFARQLTAELQSISRDKHMRVRIRKGPSGEAQTHDPLLDDYRMRREEMDRNYGFASARVLEGNVGYLDITGFPPVDLAGPTAVSSMRFLENVDALIIDLRRNGGGSPGTIQLVCSYFFGGKTHLNSLYWREGSRTQEFWTLDSIDGKRRPDLPLFLLTSHYTFSGGEEFAYNLKTRNRASLIGETTGGGANPGGLFPLDPGVVIFIPTGRAINPVTGDNWEGKGIEPDVSADSAAAFDVACTLAREAAGEYRESAEERYSRAVTELRDGLKEAGALLARGESGGASALVKRSLDAGRDAAVLHEGSINEIGYEYLGEKEFAMAIEVFGYNARTFPDSWNVYDSLGEAYMKKGDQSPAVENYRRSLQLNPQNSGAKDALRSMGLSE